MGRPIVVLIGILVSLTLIPASIEAIDSSTPPSIVAIRMGEKIWIIKNYKDKGIRYSYHAFADKLGLTERIFITVSAKQVETKFGFLVINDRIVIKAKEWPEGSFLNYKRKNQMIRILYTQNKLNKTQVEELYKEVADCYRQARRELETIDALKEFEKDYFQGKPR